MGLVCFLAAEGSEKCACKSAGCGKQYRDESGGTKFFENLGFECEKADGPEKCGEEQCA